MSAQISLNNDPIVSFQKLENEKGVEKVVQIDPEKISSIDYKTQALITALLGAVGVNDFYAGNYLKGFAKLALFLCLRSSLVAILVTCISLINLSQGQYADGNGKLIRQVVQLKKEEISSCDHKVAIILCSFLGWIGAHQFYAGKPLKGVLMLCSLGGFGIWQMMNLYQLAVCGFKDGQGKTVCPEYIKLSAT